MFIPLVTVLQNRLNLETQTAFPQTDVLMYYTYYTKNCPVRKIRNLNVSLHPVSLYRHT
jgi:hypothetical protein